MRGELEILLPISGYTLRSRPTIDPTRASRVYAGWAAANPVAANDRIGREADR